MKNLHVMFVLLLVVLLVAESDGWWRRRRRRRRNPPPARPCPYTCWTRCGITCSFGGGCRTYCRPQCGYRCRGKREIQDKNMVERPLSADFDFYDKNKDGKITLKEFADVISSTEEDCRKIFLMEDKDDNKYIDKIEFEISPWVRNSGKFGLDLRSAKDLDELLEDAKKEEELEQGPVQTDNCSDSDPDCPKTEDSDEDEKKP